MNYKNRHKKTITGLYVREAALNLNIYSVFEKIYYYIYQMDIGGKRLD